VPESAIKPTRRNRAVLLVLLTGAPRLDGLTIASASGTGDGGVHKTLARLAALGWVDSDWEAGKPEGERHRFYELTPDGRAHALRLLGLEDGR
jgi:DNA-binding PadR family transcriptional regulator